MILVTFHATLCPYLKQKCFESAFKDKSALVIIPLRNVYMQKLLSARNLEKSDQYSTKSANDFKSLHCTVETRICFVVDSSYLALISLLCNFHRISKQIFLCLRAPHTTISIKIYTRNLYIRRFIFFRFVSNDRGEIAKSSDILYMLF